MLGPNKSGFFFLIGFALKKNRIVNDEYHEWIKNVPKEVLNFFQLCREGPFYVTKVPTSLLCSDY